MEPPPLDVHPTVLPYRRAEVLADAPDNCYRCGYPLLGIADEQACPECGLLARRSRRTTDELHNSRPRWLTRISRGADLILIAVITSVMWPLVLTPGMFDSYWLMFGPGLRSLYPVPWVGLVVASALLLVGAWLLTSREGYPPADRADRSLRTLLRIAAAMPLAAVLLACWRQAVWRGIFLAGLFDLRSFLEYAAWTLAILGFLALPMLLFLQLPDWLSGRAARTWRNTA